jgi:hypothetical protein
VARGFARASTLTTACFIGLGVSSCSLLLDWSGYTDGGAMPFDAPEDASVDAHDAADGADARDAHDSASASETSVSDAPTTVRDVEVTETAPPSRCGPLTCGGCCTSDGFCAGGSSSATCGVSSAPCEDCTRTGQSCDHGMCVSSFDAGTPACTNNSQCNTTLCIPVVETFCCRSDGTCGCQVMMPGMSTCM